MHVQPRVRLEHTALVYDDVDEMLGLVVPFIEDGWAEGEHVLVEAPTPTVALVQDVLPETVRSGLLGDLVGHPHQALWGLRQLLDDDLADGAPVRVVTQIGDLGSADARDEWGRVESLYNHVMADCALSLLCLYEDAGADPDTLALVRATHPVIRADGSGGHNPGYERPRDYLRAVDRGWAGDPLETVAPDAVVGLSSVADLSTVKAEIDTLLDVSTLPASRREEFSTAVFEVAVNALMHGGDNARVSIWRTAALIHCRIRDDGPGLSDPLIGYEPPTLSRSTRAEGLWSARQLADHLTTTAEPLGFTVRLSVDL